MATMADKRDFYDVLGVERAASKEAIAEAYRKLAMEYHPDRNPGDQEAIARFKEAAEAFEVLSDPEKRARYDRFGHEGLAGQASQFHDVGDIFEAFGDILGGGLFGDLFGSARRRGRRASKGEDIRCELELDLLEAARGVSKTVRFRRRDTCTTCEGSGAQAGTDPESCPYCGGRGQVVVQSIGPMQVAQTCSACRGSGRYVRNACPDCRGTGAVQKKVVREVKVPAGIDERSPLRLSGEGNASPNNGPPGDCYCFVSIREHPLFERHGPHLICQVPIGYAQAALGATLEVPTLDGPNDLEIPPGTQNGQRFVLNDCGMPIPRKPERGHLVIEVVIEVPKKLTSAHEQLLRELAKVENENVSPERKSFFSKLKKYFRAG